MLIVYYSGLSENTHRFVSKLELPNKRIPIKGECLVNEPYVLIVPSYGGGEIKGSVPRQVVEFLNNETNRINLKAVIGSGNTNFGDMYCYGAKAVSHKCGVPLLYKFELMGTTRDVDRVKDGVIKFGTEY